MRKELFYKKIFTNRGMTWCFSFQPVGARLGVFIFIQSGHDLKSYPDLELYPDLYSKTKTTPKTTSLKNSAFILIFAESLVVKLI